MDSKQREQAKFLMKSYNEQAMKYYEELITDLSEENAFSDETRIYAENTVNNNMAAWMSVALEGLEAGTPETFLDQILNLEDALEMFVIAVMEVDIAPPDDVLLRLGAFGDAATVALFEMAFSVEWGMKDDEEEELPADLMVAMVALKTVGQWQYEAAIRPVLDRFATIDRLSEYVADAIRDFVIAFGEDAVPELIYQIENAADPGLVGPWEYMLVFLTQIGMVCPAPEIFRVLKESFRRMENKIYGVLCLGDYGNPAAIPLLKSYLERNLHLVDRQFYFESLSVIKRLGGDITDIANPFTA